MLILQILTCRHSYHCIQYSTVKSLGWLYLYWSKEGDQYNYQLYSDCVCCLFQSKITYCFHHFLKADYKLQPIVEWSKVHFRISLFEKWIYHSRVMGTFSLSKKVIGHSFNIFHSLWLIRGNNGNADTTKHNWKVSESQIFLVINKLLILSRVPTLSKLFNLSWESSWKIDSSHWSRYWSTII